jgi:ferritin-like metal-binding protein YciE
MAIQSAEDLFIATLSNLHASEQRLAKAADELSQQVQDPDVKNILSVRAYLTQQDVSNLEKCFQLLGKQPMPGMTRFSQVWAEDALKEVGAIQAPGLKALYALNKIRTIQNFHVGEYAAATAMAAFVGNRAVTTLLEHTMADKIDFVERTQDFVVDLAQQALSTRAAGKAA